MNELPLGWTATTLDQIATWGSGGTPSRRNPEYYGGAIPWVKTGELGQRSIQKTEETITELGLKNSSAKIFPVGSIAIAMYGATIGKTSILGIDAATNQACAVGIPHEELATKEYLFHYLRSQKDAFIEAGKGGAQPNISQTVIKEWKIPLAPRNEQMRIADKLDAILARVDACRERLDRVPAILKRFRQAVLAAATSGKLTEDWRETSPALGNVSAECSARDSADQASSVVDLPLPITWRWSKFGEFVSSFRSGTSGVPQDEPTNFPVLRSSSVRPGKVDLSDVRFLPPGAKFRQDDLLADGDLLFTRLSGSLDYVANCAMVHGLASRRVYYPDRLFRAKVIQTSSAPYFELCFSSPNLRRFLVVEAKSSAGHQRVSMGAVTGFPIPLPPPSEQSEIVRRVEALFAYADRLEASYTAARTQVERLTPALLAKAFRGELVPQDPNDEPASALLERIRASRAAAGEKPTRKARSERKPMTTIPTTDTLKEIIRGLPTDHFTFDDLRRQVSADYETLKDLVFALLSEAPASIKQVFDTEVKTMRLVRVK